MTRIAGTVEESQLRIISTVESRCDGIVGEIRNLKEDYTTQICAIPERNGYYKGVSCCGIIRTCGYMTRWQVRDLGVGDFRLIKTFPCLACCSARGGRRTSSHTCHDGYQYGHCVVENSNQTKFICKYQPSINNEKDIMKVSA